MSKYEEQRLDETPPPEGAPHTNQWISDKTWKAVDKQQASNVKEAGYPVELHCLLDEPRDKSSLAMDHKQRAANAASTVESHMSAGAVKEVWHALKGWYRLAED